MFENWSVSDQMDFVKSTPHVLYLHIPFCRHICTYCAFNTYAGMEDSFSAFVDALCHEISLVGDLNPEIPLISVFFGGGTPSLLPNSDYRRLLNTIRRHFVLLPNAEISIEANPNDLSKSYAEGLLEAGINRLSIGMQSANPNELELFQRQHDQIMVVEAMRAGKQAGFSSISLDLIYGIPDQTLSDWRSTLEQALMLQPQHFSLYNLDHKGGTVLTNWVKDGVVPVPDDDLSADMYELATEMLGGVGFDQYEISNWAQPGHQSRHNLQYWYNDPYLGLGPGAHGYADGVRYTVVRSPHRYIEKLKNGAVRRQFPRSPATAKVVSVDRQTEMAETIMMGLRLTKQGIDRYRFKARFGVDLVTVHQEAVEKHVKSGLLEVDEDRVCLSKAGRFLSNAVIRDFI